MLSNNFIDHLTSALSSNFQRDVNDIKLSPIYGGSINQCFAITGRKRKWFIKVNSSSRYPGMFEAEQAGMELLNLKSSFEIPRMILCGKFEESGYLIMDYVNKGAMSNNFWEIFGRRLAELHQTSNEDFGLDYENYIGSLKQSNKKCGSWSEFFINERLKPQIDLAKDKLRPEIIHDFENLFKKIEQLFPNEPPALVHGDLWSGNFMTSEKGEATIFDPAVYYGHREMDIAMTKLFGGFNYPFYDAYNTIYPLENGWKERIDICNLYPLLVHVNLFGGGYVNQVRSILKHFV